ncbi:STAS domain-containing protein [Actinoplanes sp. NPDC023801]|uniref:STAS domain-containing protein n=1 Tax=Actinoplanes sp. NPDC023801 TaxID=3154595 RepID=UPI0033F30008
MACRPGPQRRPRREERKRCAAGRDSTVISALVTARNEARATGGRFVLINPTMPVRRILQITGVLEALVAAPPQT